MKKFLIAIGLLGVIGFGTIMIGKVNSNPIPVLAEGEQEDLSATVAIAKVEHGSVEASITEGVEGDICKLNVRPELLYVINSVSVNGIALIEDENISGLFSFALVRGVNTVTVKFAVNEEILGDLSTIYAQATSKDWTNLFTVENVIIIVKWVLDCGILFAIIRYYVRDKRLANKLEEAVKKEIDKIIPNSTKETVIATITDVVAPVVAQLKADNVEMKKAMGVFAKCMALMQENTPESRIAILEALGQLNISDTATLNEIKAFVEKLFADNLAIYNETLAKIKEIGESNKAIIEEDPDVGDGTSI